MMDEKRFSEIQEELNRRFGRRARAKSVFGSIVSRVGRVLQRCRQ